MLFTRRIDVPRAVVGLLMLLALTLGLAACGGDGADTAVSESVEGGCASQPDPPFRGDTLDAAVRAGSTFDLDGVSVTLPEGFTLPLPGGQLVEGVALYRPSDGRTNTGGTARYAIFVFEDGARYTPGERSYADPLQAFISQGAPPGPDGCLEYTYVDAGRARWSYRSPSDELHQHEMVALPDGRYVEFWMHLALPEVPRQRQTAIFELVASSIGLARTTTEGQG
jgi:hypothetical protein